MAAIVILSKLEQEYLLRVVESALQVKDRGKLFLLTQGQLQALLPHQLMVCMHFDEQNTLVRLESLHGNVIDPLVLRQICGGEHALALRIARHCCATNAFPCISAQGLTMPGEALAPFQQALAAAGYDNVLVHGSGVLAGGATVFALLGMPQRPGPREAYFLQLLLPQLHVALQRLPAMGGAGAHLAVGQGPAARPVRNASAREIEILQCLREGKSNHEIGDILGISALTVKNHLQRIYQNLGVRNRTEAVARTLALRLLPDVDLAKSKLDGQYLHKH